MNPIDYTNIGTNNMTTEATTDDFIRSHIFVCGIPQHNTEQTPEHIEETTPIIMNDNTNNTNTVQTIEHTETGKNAVKALAVTKGSRVLGTLETIKSLIISRPFEARSKTYNLSKNICKRLNIDVADNVEFIALVIWENIEELIMSITEAKPTKTTRTGGVLHSETVTYAVRVLNGGLLRSNRVASALERVALRMVAIGEFDITDMPVSLDSELNKAYAAIRSQATKNGEELGGKSNAVTKTATKEAIVKAIQIMKETDSYEYDILIGNLPEQPKHLKE